MTLRGYVDRRLLIALVISLGAAALTTAQPWTQVSRAEAACAQARPIRVGDSVACMHSDEAPAGVDVHARPSTGELRARPGAGVAAYQAAQELGVPATQVATTATDPTVPCDGDGTSGYRLQGMYVVEAGKTNRYADLKASLQRWAAGADDVVNRSAALTGGVRHLRYVTEAGGGGCVASILNVTVPAGSMASFSSTVAAVQALGYTAAGRKYVMWTDATVLCGVASMYTNDGATQANPNNGAYAQYARIDAGCWGLGNGTSEHSVEAHEILHTLGGVQNTAPHSTNAGHCWDESDTMCYADGGNHAMVQVCPTEREFFFDCNNDDYFSTYPDPGGYLSSHWNAADSRFLLGGGDGSGGGSLGAPTVLGATIAVNNPAVPGLPTQAAVTPSLPTGRTVAKIVWSSKRTDCTFASPGEVQSTVTCNASATGSTTVTAVITDSSGATKTVSSPLTFATGTARPVTVGLTVAGQTGATPSVCTAASFPVQAKVVDTASGLAVKGVAVPLTKQASTATTAASAGTVTTGGEGTGTVNQSVSVATTYTAKTAASVVYAAAPTVTRVATPGVCAPVLTAAKDTASTYYGDPVTVTGRLTRTVSGVEVPVVGASLPVKLTSVSGTVTKVTVLGNAVVGANGSFALAVKPTATGTLSVELAAAPGYVATKVDLGTVTVLVPETDLTAAVDRTDVGYGNPVTLTGKLERVAGSGRTPLVGSTVTAKVTAAGKVTVVGTGKVTATGVWTIVVPLKVSGTLTAGYAGAAGQPADEVGLGTVTAGTWTTAVAATASATHVALKGSFVLSGSVSKTYAGSTVPAGAIKASVYFTATGTSSLRTR
ncbi:hypothetical protein [Marmoricola sp. RAF53]|uniref:hypothetical protein n=1 Tax=Marmoricola sp. RAF53 TaxID=3233059 RepID=UPI003F9C58C0